MPEHTPQPTPLNEERLAEIEARCNAATAGPAASRIHRAER